MTPYNTALKALMDKGHAYNSPEVNALKAQYGALVLPKQKRPVATRVGGFMADAPENDPRNQPTIRNGAGGMCPNPQYRPPTK